MSRPKGALDSSVRIVFVLLLAVLTLALSILFLIFFVPIITYYVWQLLDRTRELEKKVAALENPSGKKSEGK